MHTWHRLGMEQRFRRIAFRIAVHPKPMHAMAPRHLFAPDHRNIVLRIAGRHAGSAARAEVKINRHAPIGARQWLILIEAGLRSEEHTSELQSLMRISYAVFCLKKKKTRHVDEKIGTLKRD